MNDDRHAISTQPDRAGAEDSDEFYAAWMQVACAAQPVGAPAHAARHGGRHAAHTPEERRRLHPSVVSRLRLAQRFSRRELKDIPHA